MGQSEQPIIITITTTTTTATTETVYDDDASTSNNDASQNIESNNSINDQLKAFRLIVQNIESRYSIDDQLEAFRLTVMGSSLYNNNINNRTVENRCSNYMFLFLDNVQFHSSLVDRVKEPSSNAPLVAPSHRKVLDIWLKELVDSDDAGFVTKVFVNVNVEDELTTEWCTSNDGEHWHHYMLQFMSGNSIDGF